MLLIVRTGVSIFCVLFLCKLSNEPEAVCAVYAVYFIRASFLARRGRLLRWDVGT